MASQNALILLDGKRIAVDEKVIAMVTPGVANRRGVFETMRVYDGEIFGWKDHAARLIRGWKLLKLKGAFDQINVKQQMKRAVQLSGRRNLRIRLSYWGDEKMGQKCLSPRAMY